MSLCVAMKRTFPSFGTSGIAPIAIHMRITACCCSVVRTDSLKMNKTTNMQFEKFVEKEKHTKIPTENKIKRKTSMLFFLSAGSVCACAYVFAFIFLILFSEFLIRYTNVNENKPYAHSKHLHSYYLDIQI